MDRLVLVLDSSSSRSTSTSTSTSGRSEPAPGLGAGVADEAAGEEHAEGLLAAGDLGPAAHAGVQVALRVGDADADLADDLIVAGLGQGEDLGDLAGEGALGERGDFEVNGRADEDGAHLFLGDEDV